MNSQSRKTQKILAFKEILLQIAGLSVSQTHKVGCIAFRKNFSSISSFGYNGTYPGAPYNPETNGEEVSLEPGKSGFLHAEDNMVAKFHERDASEHIVFVSLSPCRECTIRLVNAGFKEVYWHETYRHTEHLEIFDKCNIKYGTIEDYIKRSNNS
jgi:deoxycytidylate deaminase